MAKHQFGIMKIPPQKVSDMMNTNLINMTA